MSNANGQEFSESVYTYIHEHDCRYHTSSEKATVPYLQGATDVYQQGPAMNGRDAVPGPVPVELQPADVLVGEEQRQDAGVVVRTDAEDEVGPRAGWVVVEPGVYGAPVAELADDAVVVVELQKPRRRPEDPVLDSLAALTVLVQKTPANYTHVFPAGQ